jgi:hypothetical protein
LQVPSRCLQTTANIRKHEEFSTLALGSCPSAQAFDLVVQIGFLSMSTHPCIQHDQASIEGANNLFDFCARNANFPTNLDDLNTPGLNPAPNGDRMQSEFVSGLT